MHNITRQWLIVVALLLFLFVGCFMTFQFQREQSYNKALLNTQLQYFNDRIYEEIEMYKGMPPAKEIEKCIARYHIPNLRLTLISTNGRVIYDADQTDLERYQNHIGREEVQQALHNGEGYDVRHSATLRSDFFYSATYHRGQHIIVRSALPYDVPLMKHLISNQHYFWLAAALTITLLIIFYIVMHKMRITITEKENLLAHLRISREGLGVFDSQRRLVQANNLFAQYVNLLSDEYLQMTEDIIDTHEMQPIRIFLNRQSIRQHNTGEPEPYMSHTVHKNGRTLIVNCVIFQDGGFEISINDVTVAEEQARMKRQLSENIAHELKTPVSSIHGYLETITENMDTLPPQRFQHFIERCYAQSRRLLHLVDDISTLNRLSAEAEKQQGTSDTHTASTVETEDLDIADIVRTVMQDVSGEIEQQKMHVDNLLPNTLPYIGEASSIYSIFRNLTDNAIAYAGTETTITLRLLRDDHEFYYFCFADNGVGVEEQHLPRLFDRFYRVDKGRSRKLGGTGLGLAIVKNAVVLHGGSITARTNQPHGLEFIFTLQKKDFAID